MTGTLARIAAIQSQLGRLPAPVTGGSGPAGGAAAGSSAAASRQGFAEALATAVASNGGTADMARGALPAQAVRVPGLGARDARLQIPEALARVVGAGAPGGVPGLPGVADPAPSTAAWVLPVDGRVTSEYGMRTHPVTGVYKLHTGTDFAAPEGTPIRAASGGVVRSAGWQNGNGNTVVVDHGGGVSTLYAHASALLVKPGQRIEAGESIAKVGSTGYSTGPHLHLEVRRDDKPVDPGPWLRRHGVRL